jgi:glycosyltransferase involved in cell wall biosynthesis
MENNKLISVIIPFYNAGDYVKKTIKSLESQAYRNFEVIFVNDGSIDNSLKIIETQLEDVSFNYKIINLSENRGLSNARNVGLSKAVGEYIFFLDSDDYITKDAFEKVIELFMSENPDVVFFQFKRVEENGELFQHYNELFKNVNKIETSRNILMKYLNLEIFIYACSIVYKKEIIKKLSFNEIGYIEDQDFTIRALLESDKVGYINSELINYTKREGSIMNSKFSLKKLDKIKLFDMFYNQYKTKDEELSKTFSMRRSKELLWITRAYIKSEKNLKIKEIKKYIQTNILTDKTMPYFEKKYLKELNFKNIIQFFLLKYFPTLYINLIKLS